MDRSDAGDGREERVLVGRLVADEAPGGVGTVAAGLWTTLRLLREYLGTMSPPAEGFGGGETLMVGWILSGRAREYEAGTTNMGAPELWAEEAGTRCEADVSHAAPADGPIGVRVTAQSHRRDQLWSRLPGGDGWAVGPWDRCQTASHAT